MSDLKLVYCEKCGMLHTRKQIDENNEKLSLKIMTCPYCKGKLHYLEDETIVSIKDYNLKDNQTFLKMNGYEWSYEGSLNYVLSLEKKCINEIVSKLPTFDKYAMYDRLDNQHKKAINLDKGNEAAAQRMRDEAIQREREKNAIRCPRCNSTAVTTGQRGYSLLTGFWGSNKTVNRCGNCGYKWKPR